MRNRYIDFISDYCDRWCERCQFTERCSSYAVQVALEMCDGNFEEALELAVGAPPPRTAREARRRDRFAKEIASIPPPTEQEIEAFTREEEERDERIEETPLATASERSLLLSHRWLKDHADRLAADAPPALAEALQIAQWDCVFVHAKLHRAQSGLDRARHGEDGGEHRVQNDWNGSAKVALISIARSVTAWEAIADATHDPDAGQVVVELRALQREVEQAFPDAWKFRRPGFDGVRRWRW